MILTDYFLSDKDMTWDIGRQCGVEYGTIRLPEDNSFDITDKTHWQMIYKRFMDFGITPIIIEPMPNALHDHIKSGDLMRDECIDKVIRMLPIMDSLDIRMICFNFMAHIGWCRTNHNIHERGGAFVTGFDMDNFAPTNSHISEAELWDNYTYFIKAVVPYAEKYGIKLALHPDDPPIHKLGGVSRIMISYDNIHRAIHDIVKSDMLGVTMCQASYYIMGEDLYKVIPELADKVFFVHFRNTTGTKLSFRETFHDNGDLEMAKLVKLYRKCKIDVPIRVDHVPTMVGEKFEHAGYDALGRFFAIGYLKGLLEATE